VLAVEQLGLPVQELLDLALHVGGRAGGQQAGARQLERRRRVGAERRARRMIRLDRLRAGAPGFFAASITTSCANKCSKSGPALGIERGALSFAFAMVLLLRLFRRPACRSTRP
jgi:hypothetical protein